MNQVKSSIGMRDFRSLVSAVIVLFASLCFICQAKAQDPIAIGERVQEFTLDNYYGAPVSLSDFSDKRLIVIAYLGTECPLAKLYGPRLESLQQQFSDHLQVIGINSNRQDSMSEISSYAHRHALTFPVLKDVGNKLADIMGAQRTPEVFLLDADRAVQYHGRIDDQYAVGSSRDKFEHAELAEAIQQLVQDQPVAVANTEVAGCHIGRIQAAEPTGEITYTQHIASIFNSRCVSCHREGEIAPFTLTSYDDIQGWEETILEVIEDRRMPPWSANPDHGSFQNDARLSDEEKELIFAWIENGMPMGDLAHMPEPPVFTKGWRISEPDQVIAMRDEPFRVPAEGIVEYQRFVVDPGWTEDKYIVAAEARPQNRAVVHHILVYVILPGKDEVDLERALVGYAPGSLPVELDKGIAMHAPAGSRLLFELHYTPNGTPQEDLSYVGFCFTEKENVEKHLQGRIAANTDFEIPAHADNHEVVAHYRVTNDEYLISMTPHMHLRGKAFRYRAKFPDGSEEILLDVPAYDFNWQLKYILEEPRLLPTGTAIECTALFNNSASNRSNPDPTVEVRWGDQSADEMMIGFMDTIAK